jgi:hypothetical protein
MESRIEMSKGNGMHSTHSTLDGYTKKMPFNSRQYKTRTMRAAVASVFTEVDLANFNELSADETIHSGLERELLRFDEASVSMKIQHLNYTADDLRIAPIYF